MNEKRPFSPRRALWKLICLLLGLILTAMLATTALFRYLTEQIHFTAPVPEASLSSLSSSEAKFEWRPFAVATLLFIQILSCRSASA